MQYTLILPNGKLVQFYIRSVAEMYQTINGGTLVSEDILQEAMEASRNALVSAIRNRQTA